MASAVLAAAALSASPPRAHACGGCFAPTGQPSIVRAHRMAVALSPQGTTLWDQFEYVGEPEDFVWVLPVSGGQDVDVELADNAFFQALSQATAVTLQGPQRFPAFTGGGGSGGVGCGGDAAFSAPSGAAEMPRSPPVTVFREEVVGPYETLVIGSTEGMSESLVGWLQDNGYGVPDAMLPTIQHYIDQEMNFVVLRLSPGETVQRMQPVRVTTPGLNVVFPLRMVAAGVEDAVSLEIFVFAEGRVEADGFTNSQIDTSLLEFDWATGLYNYDSVATSALAEDGGRVWLTEFAAVAPRTALQSFSITDDVGEVHTARDDLLVVETAIALPYLTRMRAVLPVDALSQDLVLLASEEADVGNVINVTRDRNWTGAPPPPRTMGAFPIPFAILAALGLYGIIRRRFGG
jgi:hypothetical protein